MNKLYFEDLRYNQYKFLFEKYVAELKHTEYLRNESIAWSDAEGTINVFVIRCNDMYITNDIQRNNDWLVVIENRPEDSFRRYIFKCTADPKYRRNKIANLVEQIYYGNVRNHRWIPGRDAICQDNNEIYVRRYENGEWFEEKGHFGINIHNSAGFFNTSLGCVVLASEDSYLNEFRPLLRRVQKINIPVAVLRDTKFEELL